MDTLDTAIAYRRTQAAQPKGSYDLSQPPVCKPVDEQALRDHLRRIDEFQEYSRRAVASLNIVIGGEVPVGTR